MVSQPRSSGRFGFQWRVGVGVASAEGVSEAAAGVGSRIHPPRSRIFLLQNGPLAMGPASERVKKAGAKTSKTPCKHTFSGRLKFHWLNSFAPLT